MQLSDQVVSLEYAQKLKELGVNQESLFYWRDNDGFENCKEADFSIVDYINPSVTIWYASAFTASELLEFLPSFYKFDKSAWLLDIKKSIKNNIYVVEYKEQKRKGKKIIFAYKNLCNALSRMLIHLIETGIIKND